MLLKLYKKILDDRYECYHINYCPDDTNSNQYCISKIHELLETNITVLELDGKKLTEIGPRNYNKTAWSTNIKNICDKANMLFINYIVKTTIYLCGIDENANYYYDKMTEAIYDSNQYLYNSTNTVTEIEEYNETMNLNDYLEKINKDYGLSLSSEDMEYIKKNFVTWNNPLFIMFDIAQSNSEHSRHHFFNGRLFVDGAEQDYSLFQLVKQPLLHVEDNNSLVAFSDNSSVIKGRGCYSLYRNEFNQYKKKFDPLNIVLTAETHNFPTAIEPFSGAATGIGGRIRDVQATGRGALPICSSAGYCVGNLFSLDNIPKNIANPTKILIDASNGASDYGNKFGEPIILGFTRSFKLEHNNERIEWLKPIMFTAGLGVITSENTFKTKAREGMLICKIGGPVYKIGFGGSAASSRVNTKETSDLDFDAVQRADAEMEQKLNNVIKSCIEARVNPIESIHDQGAGGNGNVLKEIIENKGAIINIGKLTMGQDDMNDIEIWLSEYQESNAILVDNKNSYMILNICKRENLNIDIIGRVTNNRLNIFNNNRLIACNYKLPNNTNKRKYYLESCKVNVEKFCLFNSAYTLEYLLEKTLSNVAVGSKRFLTNKVDRSVTGLIAQQQCVGPLHTPLSNFGLFSQSYFKGVSGCFSGCATSIGEQPIIGLIDPIAMVQKTVAEMLTNLVWVLIDRVEKIRCSANWMWPLPHKDGKEGYKMYQAMKELNRVLITLGIAVDGGKDSLSMAVNYNDSTIKAPGSLVLSAYVTCPDISKKVTPDLKQSNTFILFIDLSDEYCRMGGSIVMENDIYYTPPKINDILKLKKTFNVIQGLIYRDKILAGHDKSDGGLITTLIEMAISGNKGLHVEIDDEFNILRYLFNEEIGMVIEVEQKHMAYVLNCFTNENIRCKWIGRTTPNYNFILEHKNKVLYKNSIVDLRMQWEKTSFTLEKLQCNIECVEQEMEALKETRNMEYNIPCTLPDFILTEKKYRVGIIREEGTNGYTELAAAFYYANFHVIDVHMNDIISERVNINEFHGIAFAGGFSYADVLGSAKGWYHVIKNNTNVYQQFQDFYNRENTFSIGICNGCQLMAHLGWIDGKLYENKSQRFESRFSTVRINKSDNIFLKGMEGTVFGIWVAHGEGRFVSNDTNIPIQYVDLDHNPTEKYPYNPNGSERGIAALSSKNNRHLAIMPHPERSFLGYQVPIGGIKEYTPWYTLFKNAYISIG